MKNEIVREAVLYICIKKKKRKKCIDCPYSGYELKVDLMRYQQKEQ